MHAHAPCQARVSVCYLLLRGCHLQLADCKPKQHGRASRPERTRGERRARAILAPAEIAYRWRGSIMPCHLAAAAAVACAPVLPARALQLVHPGYPAASVGLGSLWGSCYAAGRCLRCSEGGLPAALSASSAPRSLSLVLHARTAEAAFTALGAERMTPHCTLLPAGASDRRGSTTATGRTRKACP